MPRDQLVQYLVNLHVLMSAQTQTSPWLATEYQRVWDELKAELKPKDKEQ